MEEFTTEISIPGSNQDVCHDDDERVAGCLESRQWDSVLTTLYLGTNEDQMSVLNEFSHFLSYANEDSLVGFPCWKFLRALMYTLDTPHIKYNPGDDKLGEPSDPDLGLDPPLYNLLASIYKERGLDHTFVAGFLPRAPSSPCDESDCENTNKSHHDRNVEFFDISPEVAGNKMIAAATCINTILDILPHASRYFSNPLLFILKSKLRDIHYIDLAERIILILEKLSREIPERLVTTGLVIIMLERVDFFSLNIQLLIYRTILGIFKGIRGSCVAFSEASLCRCLSEQLGNSNRRIVQLVCQIWRTVVDLGQTRGDGSVMKSLLRYIDKYNTLENMFQLVLENEMLKRRNINDLLYIIASCLGSSDSSLASCINCDLLKRFGDWFKTVKDDETLAHIMQVANALVYCDGEIRLRWYVDNPDLFYKLVNVFSPEELLKIYGTSLNEVSRHHILTFIAGLIQVALQVQHLKDFIINVLPLAQLVEICCYSLSHPSGNVQVSIFLCKGLLTLYEEEAAYALNRNCLTALLRKIGAEETTDLLERMLHYKHCRSNVILNTFEDLVEAITTDKREDTMKLTSFELSSCNALKDAPFESAKDVLNFKSLVEKLDGANPDTLSRLWADLVSVLELRSHDCPQGYICEEQYTTANKGYSSGDTAFKIRNAHVDPLDVQNDSGGSSSYGVQTTAQQIASNPPCTLLSLYNKLKVRLRHIRQVRDSDRVPSIVLYMSPLASMSKLEQHIVKMTSLHTRQKVDGSVNCSLSDEENVTVIGAVLSLRRITLSSKACLIDVLMRYSHIQGPELWSTSHLIGYKLIRRHNGSDERIHVACDLTSGKNSPMNVVAAKQQHSSLGLYLDLVRYCGGKCDTSLSNIRNAICEQIRRAGRSDADIFHIATDACDITREGNTNDSPNYNGGNHKNADDGDCTGMRRIPEYNSHICALDMADAVMEGKRVNDIFATIINGRRDVEDEVSEGFKAVLEPLLVLYRYNIEKSIFQRSDVVWSISHRLTLRLLRHLGNVRDFPNYHTVTWIVRLVMSCPSLFSLESRRILFDKFKGPHRYMSKMMNRLKMVSGGINNSACMGEELDHWSLIDESLLKFLGTMEGNSHTQASTFKDLETWLDAPRFKVGVDRTRVLDEAGIIFHRQATSTEFEGIPRIEVGFKGEEGTGSGPTLEFYSLVIDSILSPGEESLFDYSSGYAFPKVFNHKQGPGKQELACIHLGSCAPAAKNNGQMTSFGKFYLLGQTVASALLDSRRLDVRLHPHFMCLVQSADACTTSTSFETLSSVDPQLANTLLNITLENIVDMGLMFEYNGAELVPNGSQIPVDASNMQEFKLKVTEYRLRSGIKQFVWAFRMGYATIMPIESLWVFTPIELSTAILSNGQCNQDAWWTRQHLASFITPDHGYDASSPAYNNFITVLSELSLQQRRLFLQFCTGAPILPRRGFAALEPNMKVVKRGNDQSQLPSVMTCTSYLKLPNYSSIETCRMQLLKAITDGAESFTLS